MLSACRQQTRGLPAPPVQAPPLPDVLPAHRPGSPSSPPRSPPKPLSLDLRHGPGQPQRACGGHPDLPAASLSSDPASPLQPGTPWPSLPTLKPASWISAVVLLCSPTPAASRLLGSHFRLHPGLLPGWLPLPQTRQLADAYLLPSSGH